MENQKENRLEVSFGCCSRDNMFAVLDQILGKDNYGPRDTDYWVEFNLRSNQIFMVWDLNR